MTSASRVCLGLAALGELMVVASPNSDRHVATIPLGKVTTYLTHVVLIILVLVRSSGELTKQSSTRTGAVSEMPHSLANARKTLARIDFRVSLPTRQDSGPTHESRAAKSWLGAAPGVSGSRIRIVVGWRFDPRVGV